jgi:hypothetical protein
MSERSQLRTGVVCVLCLGLIGFSINSLRLRSAALPADGLPKPAELDSLSRYLTPVPPAPPLDDYAAFLPARPALRAPDPVVEDTRPDEWQLSAILITGARPMAIINDQAVARGARLPDGAVVLEIDRTQVIIRAPNGARRRLVLTDG